jgi:hypothetical protein
LDWYGQVQGFEACQVMRPEKGSQTGNVHGQPPQPGPVRRPQQLLHPALGTWCGVVVAQVE